MIKLVACDVDGTLLPEGQTVLPDWLFGEIERLKEKGILFCPTSGRQYNSLRQLFHSVSSELFFICENGAVVYEPGNPGCVLYKLPMKRTDALRLCDDIQRIAQCEVLVSGANISYVVPKTQKFVERLRDQMGNNVCILDDFACVPEDIVKVSAFCPNGFDQNTAKLAEQWRHTFHPALSGGGWLDFNLVNKGMALKALCVHLKIEPQEVMAFGDNENDISMLSFVGKPYLMDFAKENLKNMFSSQCGCVRDVLVKL